ncbi:hypothetical protein [Deinococcus sp.]|uniref:hypothetical protein n=1 Tax=Deinococcus sp. TaxID=47478 RepID=UPI0025F5A5B3|nr:hypothetical protein [Deinococcus sp.]
MNEAVPILLAIFGGVFGGVSLMNYVSGISKVRVMQEKRALIEAQNAAQLEANRPAPLPAPAPLADPNAAPVLALKLPEPLRSKALALLVQIQDAPGTLDARSAYLVRQTAGDYLPQTLKAYLDLTPGARSRLSAQGMDPDTLAAEQLDLMAAGVSEALRLDHAAADRLLTQGRFLRERFAPGPDELVLSGKADLVKKE